MGGFLPSAAWVGQQSACVSLLDASPAASTGTVRGETTALSYQPISHTLETLAAATFEGISWPGSVLWQFCHAFSHPQTKIRSWKISFTFTHDHTPENVWNETSSVKGTFVWWEESHVCLAPQQILTQDFFFFAFCPRVCQSTSKQHQSVCRESVTGRQWSIWLSSDTD